MANTNQINGLIPHSHLSGAKWNGQTRIMYKAAGTTVTNDLFPGDPVVLAGSGDANGIPSISKATLATNYPTCGIVVSIVPLANHLERTWLDGADAGYVNVCVDPSTIYEAQADDVLTYTDIGRNVIAIQTQAGSRTTGASGIEIDATTATTNTHTYQIVGFPQRESNALNTENNKVLVRINNHQFANLIAGV